MVEEKKFKVIDSVPGLRLFSNFISEAEEKELLNLIDVDLKENWSSELSRKTQQYGYKYNYFYPSSTPVPMKPIPEKIREICIKKLKSIGLYGDDAKAPNQCIVNNYEVGQGISAHTDNSSYFGKTICSLTLSSACNMKFSSDDNIVNVYLPRRSLVVLEDDARWIYKHEIEKLKYDLVDGVKIPRGRRVSITFRQKIK